MAYELEVLTDEAHQATLAAALVAGQGNFK